MGRGGGEGKEKREEGGGDEGGDSPWISCTLAGYL